ncbi:hypothetical protein [Novosphingobium cyanobacteriorum]|uniref:Uncharacterized protein n=1 Tax=Novosphingobium cyanobacteriorum TaxID=3024215 RepID=A0ABT6CJ81_9SPHN|nr:hypothetical protein [Novosphingobium cyanobacteriorum]MDF8333965.1 hypothetical protein [Novosphingobium cyanobacteriorum]
MKLQDPIAKILAAGLVLGILIGLATPTTILAPPDPPWRGKGAALAQRQQQTESYAATFSGETFNPAPWPGERGESIPPKVAHARVYAGADWRLDSTDFPPEPPQREVWDDYDEQEAATRTGYDDPDPEDIPSPEDDAPVEDVQGPANY